jgi:predicted homoserine dehydrogenase-like protein
MVSIAEAFLDRSAALAPTAGFVTNVYAYAKKDLRPGDSLDGVGGYAAYGLIENCSDNQLYPGLPICLADGVTLRRAIRKDERILLADVIYEASDPGFRTFMRAPGGSPPQAQTA